MSEFNPSSNSSSNRPNPDGSDPLDTLDNDSVWDVVDRANRPEAPAYFTLRVMQKIEAMPRRSSWWSPSRWQTPGLAWLAPAAASCALLLFAASRIFPTAQTSNTVDGSTDQTLATTFEKPFVPASTEVDAEVVEVLDQLVAFEDNSAWLNPAAM